MLESESDREFIVFRLLVGWRGLDYVVVVGIMARVDCYDFSYV